MAVGGYFKYLNDDANIISRNNSGVLSRRRGPTLYCFKNTFVNRFLVVYWFFGAGLKIKNANGKL